MARGVSGLRQLNLGVNANKAAAIRLYESLGFQAFGHEAGAMLIAGTLHYEVHVSSQWVANLSSLSRTSITDR